MSAKLSAYHGGSGMWFVSSADGKRSYSVMVTTRGKVKIINRRGAMLNPTGPTAQEVQRAIKSARDNARMAAAAVRNS